MFCTEGGLMRIDMHCHMVGKGDRIDHADEEVYFNPYDNNHWVTRILYGMLEKQLDKLGADVVDDDSISTHEYLTFLKQTLFESEELDAITLLAFDAVYEEPEESWKEPAEWIDPICTDLYVTNTFLHNAIQAANSELEEWRRSDPVDRHGNPRTPKRFLFGASVSPNRPDWREELRYVIEETDAVLCKIIPSTHHVILDAERDGVLMHRDYYETLAEAGLPLLCHVGPEYSFPEGMRHKELDRFARLEAPLSCGTTVIAAHCASPVFPLIDADTITDFGEFMQKMNAEYGKTDENGHSIPVLYADTSALSLSTRLVWLSKIRDTLRPEWLLHGSDFPIPIDAWCHHPFLSGNITFDEFSEIRRTRNPFDRDVRIKRAHGFAEETITSPGAVLRMP